MIRGTYIAAVLLLVAGILLVVASVSAPISSKLYMFEIESTDTKTVFGSFGYCLNVLGNNDNCSARQLGYNVSAIAAEATPNTYYGGGLGNLTHAFVLHPVAAAFAFIACIICLVSFYTGLVLAWFVIALAFLASAAVMVLDFIVFANVRQKVNTDTTAHASFANGVWVVVAATIALFFAIIAVSADCCCAGDRRSRYSSSRLDEYLAEPRRRYYSGGESAGRSKDAMALESRKRYSAHSAGGSSGTGELPPYPGPGSFGETGVYEKGEKSGRGY